MEVGMGNIAADMRAVFESTIPSILQLMVSVSLSNLESIAFRVSTFFTSFSNMLFLTTSFPASLSFLFLEGREFQVPPILN